MDIASPLRSSRGSMSGASDRCYEGRSFESCLGLSIQNYSVVPSPITKQLAYNYSCVAQISFVSNLPSSVFSPVCLLLFNHGGSLLAVSRCCCRHETGSEAIFEERGIGLGRVTKRRGGEWEERSFCHSAQTYPTLFLTSDSGFVAPDNNIYRLQTG